MIHNDLNQMILQNLLRSAQEVLLSAKYYLAQMLNAAILHRQYL